LVLAFWWMKQNSSVASSATTEVFHLLKEAAFVHNAGGCDMTRGYTKASDARQGDTWRGNEAQLQRSKPGECLVCRMPTEHPLAKPVLYRCRKSSMVAHYPAPAWFGH
jgi:hypothetical protein